MLRLTTEEIRKLGLKIKGNKVSGKVLDKDLSEAVPAFVNVLDLVRVRDVEPPSLEELEQKYLTPGITSKAKTIRSTSKRARKNA